MKYIKRFDEYLSQNISKLKTFYDKRIAAEDREAEYGNSLNPNYEFIFLNYYPKVFNSKNIKDVAKELINDMIYNHELEDIDLIEKEKIINNIKKEFNNNTYANLDSVTRLYLYDKFIYYIINDYDDREDTYNYMKFENIVKKQWLIHLTSEKHAKEIIKNGFKGNDDILNLSYSYTDKHVDIINTDKNNNGYNFSFTIPDFIENIDYIYKRKNNSPKYGDVLLIFKSSGVRVHHKGDQEYQTIFHSPDAKNINIIKKIYIKDDEGDDVEKFAVIPKDGVKLQNRKYLVIKDTVEDCIVWFTTNYNQYKKYLN